MNDTTVVPSFAVANREPPHALDQGAVGVRVVGQARGVDWALSYYDGVETAPNFVLATSVRCAATVLDRCDLLTLRRLDGRAVLRPRFDRMRQVAGDAAFQLGGFTARAEAAYGVDRRLPRPIQDLLSIDTLRESLGPDDIRRLAGGLSKGRRVPIDVGDLFVSRDVVQWGAGVDYLYEGWSPLLQVNQTLVLGNRTRLLLDDVDTRIVLALRKKFVAETLASEVFVIQGFPRSYSLGVARVTYNVTDDLRVRVGYLLIAGSRNTLIGEYHANDQAFIQVRYSY
jgi:hypothetical protein